jgi:hypothetical protein
MGSYLYWGLPIVRMHRRELARDLHDRGRGATVTEVRLGDETKMAMAGRKECQVAMMECTRVTRCSAPGTMPR